MVGGALEFTNLSETYGFVTAETRYRSSWSRYDNDDDVRQPLTQATELRSASRLEIPSNVGPDQFLVAEIHSINAENSHWNTAVRVYLRPSASGHEIVGIERDSPEPFTFPMD